MDVNDGVTAFMGLAVAGGGWIFRQMWTKMMDMSADLNVFKIQVAKEYVEHDRLYEILEPMAEDIKEIKEVMREKN